jgi:uncharacterized protein
MCTMRFSTSRCIALTIVAALSIHSRCVVAQPSASAAQDCRSGFYRLRDGSGIDIGASEGIALRWRRADGTSGALTANGDQWVSTTGWTGRIDDHRFTFPDCVKGLITVDGVAGQRVPFVNRETSFESAGVQLAGRLVLPAGADKVPLVVLVHGSEQGSAREFYAHQRLFPSQGIGAFVYDKRGTGASGGAFTHDYHQLAADATAAIHEARRLAGARAGRTGFFGTSQGGWVAPLAASQTSTDFLIVGFGLAVSPFDEDDEAVTLDMTRHGFGAAEVQKALEIAHAAQAVVLNNFQAGYAQLDAVRAKYAQEPWVKFVRGNATQVVLSQPPEVLRMQGPVMLAGVLPHYDPMPVLRSLDVPQLWVLGADDIDAPIAETVLRLRSLMRARRPITIAIYPRAEHGIYEYELDAAGERHSLRQPATYLTLMCDFIRRGKIGARYGDSTIYR